MIIIIHKHLLTKASFKVIVEDNKVSPESPFIQAKQVLFP